MKAGFKFFLKLYCKLYGKIRILITLWKLLQNSFELLEFFFYSSDSWSVKTSFLWIEFQHSKWKKKPWIKFHHSKLLHIKPFSATRSGSTLFLIGQKTDVALPLESLIFNSISALYYFITSTGSFIDHWN